MSSITISMGKNYYVFGVDSALSYYHNDKLYRVPNKNVEKICMIGADLCFFSGANPQLEYAKKKTKQILDDNNHIKIYELQKYFKETFPNSNNPRAKKRESQVGITILSIVNGKTHTIGMKQCYNDYEIKEVESPEEGITVSVDGFKNEEISQQFEQYFSRDRNIFNPQNYFDLYQDNYSEGIGGEISVYLFSEYGLALIEKRKLNESGLRYFDLDNYLLMNLGVDYDGWLSKSIGHHINGGTPLTTKVIDDYTYNPKSHNHSSTEIVAVDTGYGNINLSGFDNAAGVNYVQANFESKSSSDKRLKQNFKPLSELPDELYLELVPQQYEFICDPFNKGIVFGLVVNLICGDCMVKMVEEE